MLRSTCAVNWDKHDNPQREDHQKMAILQIILSKYTTISSTKQCLLPMLMSKEGILQSGVNYIFFCLSAASFLFLYQSPCLILLGEVQAWSGHYVARKYATYV